MINFNTLATLPTIRALTREDFTAPFEAIWEQALNEIFSSFPEVVKTTPGQRAYPKTDIYIDGEDLVFQASIPFAKKEDIRVDVEKDVLTISGECVKETETSDKNYIRRELRRSKFSRSFTLPEMVIKRYNDGDIAISAKYDDGGILTVRIPEAYKKIEEKEKKKPILIE